ncbi:archaeal DNA polymerase I [Nanobdella aerobiophila]|uniref:DNA polymerase n=1 Tax=Nanobdella aerobiophila TaxID=2586965 RepID=A0A915T029_9ARCH|nr:DNA-directed DNA polymerase [Nanobdella aerobiophila]BBL45634.1 archaeal DNA polymerase I [Nanobdella aerobiophila]
MKVFILDFDHDKEKVYVYGRDENGKKIRIEYDQPYYLYLILKDEKYLNEIKNKLDNEKYIKKYEIEKKKYIGREYTVFKIIIDQDNYDNLKKLADSYKMEGKILGKKEGDISIIKKFQLDQSIYPLNWYELDLELIKKDQNIDYYKYKKNLGIIDKKYNLKVVAFDIETVSEQAIPDPSKDPIYLITFYDGKDYYSIYIDGNSDEGYKVNSELELLKKVDEVIKKLDPDILIGYNSNNFDLYFLYERAKKLNYKFSFSWDNKNILYTKKRETSKKYKFVGIQNFDLFNVISGIFATQFNSETYSLDEIASEVLGEKKLDINFNEIYNIIFKTKDYSYLIKYNKKDVELTYKLYKHFESILLEISRLAGITLYELSGSTYGILVEDYLIKRSRDNNEIIPNKPSYDDLELRKKYTYSGAIVFQPRSGFYKNIAVYDFRSLYPSIIIKYNISPDTLKCDHEECKNEKIIADTSVGKLEVWYCKKNKGFISSILESIFNERIEIKKKMKGLDKDSEEYKILDSRQLSLKYIINSTYGYLGFPNSRWYCLECASSITALGRKYIMEVKDYIENKGYKVIYGDTDSIFVIVNNEKDGQDLLMDINNLLPRPLEMEFEDFYLSGIFVEKRSGEGGARKKYALLSKDGTIKLRGFEVVRRDWSEIAGEVQENILKLALEDKKDEIIVYLNDVINNIKNHKYPLKKFILREQLRKSLKEYEVSSPHVIAAKKYKDRGYKVDRGFIVEYIIVKGGEKISDKVRLPDEVKDNNYDPEYYINKQVIASVEPILKSLNIPIDSIGKIQKDIRSFFNNG